MLPATTHSPLVWEMLDVLGIRFPKEPLIYSPGENRSALNDSQSAPHSRPPSYHFKELHYVDWVQPSTLLDDNDMWAQYVPPRVSAVD